MIGPGTHQPIQVFCSYAHKDERLRDKLEKHLSGLRRQGLIQEWHDREITAGSEWKQQIDQHLESAQLILLLISPDFLHSDYCHDIEMTRALERHANGEAWVIPIHLRPVDWEGATFSKLQSLPTDIKPVTTWDNQDAAFLNIAQGIRKAVRAIQRTKADTDIVHTDLSESSTIPWRKLAGVFVLLAALAVGWWGYAQHTARIESYLTEGRQYLNSGEYELAKAAYQQALTHSWFAQQEAQLGLDKASVYDSTDGAFHADIVEQRTARIAAQSPDDPHVSLFRGDLHAVNQDYVKARESYEEAIERDPSLAHGYFRLGVVYDKLGEPETALAMYNRATEYAAWNPAYLNNLAYQYFRLEDYEQAGETYQQALNLDANLLITYFDSANYFRALGQLEQVLVYQRKGVKLIDDPQVATLKQNEQAWYFSLDNGAAYQPRHAPP